jgi:RNA polymerase sigma-70 factor (ECF subfamily)
MDDPDRPIIERVLGGETEAFAVLIRRHQQLVFAVAMSMVKQEADARDVVQQAYVSAFTGLHCFRGEALFSTWLCRIVVNQSLKVIRRKRPEWLEEQTELKETETANASLAKLRREDLRTLIQTVLEQMPPREAVVLQLFYLEEQSVKEVAANTGFTPNHVKVLLSRARKRFYLIITRQAGHSRFVEIH